jgi:hypothetical protein
VANHSFEWLPALLPSTVIVAIALFVLREILEWNRRRHASARQVKAFKTILARECELNRWALESLKRALVEMSGQSQAELEVDYEVEHKQSGQVIFKNDDGSSWPLPQAHTELMRDNMFEVAALDEKLFSLLEPAYDSVEDLAHVRESLIEYMETGNKHLEGFIDYGLNELKDVESALENLFFACTRADLDKGRVR